MFSLRCEGPDWAESVTGRAAEFLLLMQRTVPASGIAMCQNVVALAATRESASGYKPTWAGQVEAQPSLHVLHALIGTGSCLAYGGF